MANEEVNEGIVRKIQLLLNLAERGGTEAEASTAMSKAQELLAKYNLELAEVQAAHVKGGTNGAPEGKRDYSRIKRSAMYTWQQDLCRTLAQCNFCFYWVQDQYEPYNKRTSFGTHTAHRKVKRHLILGKEANTVAVRVMYEYLVETIENILPYENKDRLSRSALSWRKGCADRLMERISQKFYQMRQEKQASAEASSTALVLCNVDQSEYEANYDHMYGAGAYAKAVQKYADQAAAEQKRLESETPQQKAAREARERAENAKHQRARNARIRNIDMDAYYQGRRTGNNIGLDDQLKGE